MHPGRYPQTRTRRGIGGTRSDLKCYFRSTWEANWARYLNALIARGVIASWTYESETFEFARIRRGVRFYTPDFTVVMCDGSIQRHEIKGYMDKRSETKLKRMAKYHPTVSILVIDQFAYKQVADIVGPIIPEWEMIRGRATRLC